MIRLIIADDHPVVREGLKRIIANYKDIQLVGEAVNGDEVLALCAKPGADVLLLDISMPGLGFLEILHRIEAKHPLIRTLVLSIHTESHYVIRAIKAGAAGYLTKNHSPEELAQAIHQVHGGNSYVSPSLADTLITALQTNKGTLPHQQLSDREYQVLGLIGSGKDTSGIAAALSLSPKTIGTYRARIQNKLGLKSTAELIRYALDNKITE